MCCTSKMELTLLAHECERFFAKLSANGLLCQKCFCWKIACYIVQQLRILHKFLSEKCVS